MNKLIRIPFNIDLAFVDVEVFTEFSDRMLEANWVNRAFTFYLMDNYGNAIELEPEMLSEW